MLLERRAMGLGLALGCGAAMLWACGDISSNKAPTSVPVADGTTGQQDSQQAASFSLREANGTRCLGFAAAGQTPRTGFAASCTGATTQSFTWAAGHFYTSDGACMTYAGAGNELVATTCDSSDPNQQWFFREGLLYLPSDAYNTLVTISSGSIDAKYPVTGVFSLAYTLWTIDTAPQGSDGVLVYDAAAPQQCLALMGNTLARLTCSMTDPTQRWSFANGTIGNQNRCLASFDQESIAWLSCAASDGNAQWWLGGSGDLVTVLSGMTAPRVLAHDTGSYMVMANDSNERFFGLGRAPAP